MKLKKTRFKTLNNLIYEINCIPKIFYDFLRNGKELVRDE